MKGQNDKPTPVYGIAALFGLSGFSGAGTVSEWKLPDIPFPLPIESAGSILLGVVGIIGLAWIIATLSLRRSWAIILLTYLLDVLLTILFILPIYGSVIADPLSLWPYVLSTLATFCAAFVAGFVGHWAPLSCACAIVSLDFFVSGALGIISPQAATWKLISRIIAAYSSAMVGATIGQYSWAVLQKDRLSIGKFFSAVIFAIATAVISGVLAAYLSK